MNSMLNLLDLKKFSVGIVECEVFRFDFDPKRLNFAGSERYFSETFKVFDDLIY